MAQVLLSLYEFAPKVVVIDECGAVGAGIEQVQVEEDSEDVVGRQG